MEGDGAMIARDREGKESLKEKGDIGEGIGRLRMRQRTHMR